LERAGTPPLQSRIQKKIQKILESRQNLKNRLKFEKAIKREDQMIYYSAWYFAAVHIALAIPTLRTRGALSKAFLLPQSKVSEVLGFLIKCGLVQEKHGEYTIGNARLHLEKDSPMILKHHTNWRIKSIQSLESETQDELHYSSVVSFGNSDVPKVREILVKAIEDIRSTIKPSPDEVLYCYTLDFFHLIKESF
jgi:hypothetical protein